MHAMCEHTSVCVCACVHVTVCCTRVYACVRVCACVEHVPESRLSTPTSSLPQPLLPLNCSRVNRVNRVSRANKVGFRVNRAISVQG
jgi:hypothetical protein